MKPFQKTLLATSITIATLTLAACGGGGGDKASAPHVQMSGSVVDDYIAFSKVYVDVNKNGKFDPSFEPYAYTDGSGYFSKSKDGADYCADPKSINYKFCLNVDENMVKDTIIRVEGGRDLLTALQYNASMTLQTNGKTSGLTISALSSLNQVQQQLKTMTLSSSFSSSLKAKTTGKDLQNFLESFLASSTKLPTSLTSTSTHINTTDSLYVTRGVSNTNTDPNILNPFDYDKTFSLAINIHKVAETIAAYFEKNNLKFKPNNYLKRTAGSKLTQKDIVPFVYMALFLNLNFSSGNTNTALNFNANSILNDTKTLLGIVSSEASTVNIDSIKSTITSLYNYLDGLNVDSTDPRKTLAKAEMMTQSLKKKITDTDNVSSITASDVTAIKNLISTSTVQNYQNIDFETAIQQAAQGNTISATGRTFKPILDKVLNNHYLFLGSSQSGDEDKFKVYFKEDSQPTAKQRFGTITVCQQTTNNDGSTKNNLFKGSWSWSTNKTYAILAQYLGVSVTIKNLDPTINTTDCVYSTGSCVAITYPDISSNNNILKTQYSSDSTNWNDSNNIINSALIKPLGNSDIPTEPSQCKF